MSRMIDADAYIKHICGETCNSRDECDHKGQMRCQFIRDINNYIGVQTNIYDQTEYHFNCVVQILKNSVTGETSIGWTPMESETAKVWRNEEN